MISYSHCHGGKRSFGELEKRKTVQQIIRKLERWFIQIEGSFGRDKCIFNFYRMAAGSFHAKGAPVFNNGNLLRKENKAAHRFRLISGSRNSAVCRKNGGMESAAAILPLPGYVKAPFHPF